jgi:hypothetical protein
LHGGHFICFDVKKREEGGGKRMRKEKGRK